MGPVAVGPANCALGKIGGTLAKRRLARIGGRRGLSRVGGEMLARGGSVMESELLLYQSLSK